MASETLTGTWGWAALAGYIAAYDTWALKTGRETLSSAFGRSLRHPIKRWPTLLLYGIVSLHLFNRLPEWLDPLHQYGRVIGKPRIVFAEVDNNLTVVLDVPLPPGVKRG